MDNPILTAERASFHVADYDTTLPGAQLLYDILRTLPHAVLNDTLEPSCLLAVDLHGESTAIHGDPSDMNALREAHGVLSTKLPYIRTVAVPGNEDAAR